MWRVRVDLLTREYPPHVYGGGRGPRPPLSAGAAGPPALRAGRLLGPPTGGSPAGTSATVCRETVDRPTRESPPRVYSGAGVHVATLSAGLRRHVDVRVRCCDDPRGGDGVAG